MTTAFAPNGTIDGLRDELLTVDKINISHVVISETSIQVFGPENPSISTRSQKRVLIDTIPVKKIDEFTYNELSSGLPVLRKANIGVGFWKYLFPAEFYKKYEPRAYASLLDFCTERDESDCESFANSVFEAYVSPISTQSCITLP